MITTSWLENPDARPSFSNIIGMIREINGGKDISLVDNMINRLDIHSARMVAICNPSGET